MGKKLLSFALVCTMLMACLTGCGGTSSSAGAAPATPATPTVSGTDAPTDASKPIDWPKKTITIICPYSAGGGSDLMARAVGEVLAQRLGVSVIVDDKPGGSGSVGMSLLAAAKPDGYTLILTAMGACALSPWTSDVGYTPENFAPICQVSDAVTVLCVNKSSGITTFEQLVEAAKAEPGSVTYGTSGAGGAHHIAVSALGLAVADDAEFFKHIAYGGGAEATTALLGNHITATASIFAEPSAYIESGDFIPVLTISDSRPDYLADVPTAKELGYDCNGGTWYAFAAPAGTDQAIVDLLEETILDIMSDATMVETFENLGNPVVLLGEQEMTEKWNNAYTSNEAVLRAIGMIP